MSETITAPSVCVICKTDTDKLVADPDIEKIFDILHYAKRLADIGEVHLRPLSESLSSLSKSELEQVRYHSNCRMIIVNKTLLHRAEKRRACSESPSPSRAVKRGRPPKSSTAGRPQRHTGTIPKEIVCIFAPPSGKCQYHGEELHRVTSDNRGQILVEIKANTADDDIRASLSSLYQPGDAHAQEKWYHSSCLQAAHRTCSNDTVVDNTNDNMRRANQMFKLLGMLSHHLCLILG